jgi:hypothetical protein
MNNKQARILNEPVAYFKVLSWNAPVETDSSDTKIIMIMIIISASDSPTETQSEYFQTIVAVTKLHASRTHFIF